MKTGNPQMNFAQNYSRQVASQGFMKPVSQPINPVEQFHT